jgi:hypothetical protein
MAQQHHDAPSREHVGGASAHGHASPDSEYASTPAGAGHEHTDADVWIIVKFGLWLAVAAVVIHIGMGFLFGLFVQTREQAEQVFPLAAGQAPRLPAAPRLQTIPVNEIYEFRLREQQILSNYGWINREDGRVQIPIAEAMRLTVERGLPVRAAEPAPAGPTAAPAPGSQPQTGQAGAPAPAAETGQAAPVPGLMPADSSAGRTMERRRQ